MAAMTRSVLVVAIALFGAGLGKAVAGTSPAPTRVGSGVPPHPASTPAAVQATTTRPAVVPPDSFALSRGLVTPSDMGGYYRVEPDSATALVDSAPCLAALAPSPSQAGRAVTGLLGPDSHSLPFMAEVVSSYTTAPAVYRSVAASLGMCSNLAFSFGGIRAVASLRPLPLDPVGQADSAWQGEFSVGGAQFTLQVGVVLYGSAVLAVIWIDSVPPSDPVMGSFTSTLSVAIGKLA